MPVDKKEYGYKYLPLFEAKLQRPMQRILIPLFFVIALYSNAQIHSQLFVDGQLQDKLQFSDSVRLANHVNKLRIDWVNQGYYFSGIDSTKSNESGTYIYMHKGEKLKSRLSGFKGRQLHSHLSKQLKLYGNGGHPFASIQLDSIQFSDDLLSGKFLIEPGPEILYDSAYFFTSLKTNHSFIYQLLDIAPGSMFSERDYRIISKKIERSSFLSLQRSPDLSFQDNKAKIFLDIKEEISSSFQGVVGLQQVQNGKTTAVGALELDIRNLFRSGKEFKLAWERFAEQSQNLSIFYKHPFFLDSKISPSFRFDLFKQDTTFLTRISGIGVNTFITPRIELFIEYESINGTLLSTNLETIRNANVADFKRNVYRLKLSKGHFQTLGQLQNGVVWNTSVSGGRKEIQRNLNLPDSYYDSINASSNFYRFETSIAYQIRLFKRQSFYHNLTVGTLQNDELLRNELYRLGGLRSLRGFNEKEFFAKSYLLSRTEFRSFFENNSYAYVFYDHLFYSSKSQSGEPYGVGLGFALETSSGQFSFALAVGHSQDQQISFSTMKAHFGYISRF